MVDLVSDPLHNTMAASLSAFQADMPNQLSTPSSKPGTLLWYSDSVPSRLILAACPVASASGRLVSRELRLAALLQSGLICDAERGRHPRQHQLPTKGVLVLTQQASFACQSHEGVSRTSRLRMPAMAGWACDEQQHLRVSTSAMVARALRVMRLKGAWNTA